MRRETTPSTKEWKDQLVLNFNDQMQDAPDLDKEDIV